MIELYSQQRQDQCHAKILILMRMRRLIISIISTWASSVMILVIVIIHNQWCPPPLRVVLDVTAHMIQPPRWVVYVSTSRRPLIFPPVRCVIIVVVCIVRSMLPKPWRRCSIRQSHHDKNTTRMTRVVIHINILLPRTTSLLLLLPILREDGIPGSSMKCNTYVITVMRLDTSVRVILIVRIIPVPVPVSLPAGVIAKPEETTTSVRPPPRCVMSP